MNIKKSQQQPNEEDGKENERKKEKKERNIEREERERNIERGKKEILREGEMMREGKPINVCLSNKFEYFFGL